MKLTGARARGGGFTWWSSAGARGRTSPRTARARARYIAASIRNTHSGGFQRFRPLTSQPRLRRPLTVLQQRKQRHDLLLLFIIIITIIIIIRLRMTENKPDPFLKPTGAEKQLTAAAGLSCVNIQTVNNGLLRQRL